MSRYFRVEPREEIPIVSPRLYASCFALQQQPEHVGRLGRLRQRRHPRHPRRQHARRDRVEKGFPRFKTQAETLFKLQLRRLFFLLATTCFWRPSTGFTKI